MLAESPSGLSGDQGTKVSFTILTYSNDRQIKNLSFEKIRSFDKIKTLVITGNQNRDEEILGHLHKTRTYSYNYNFPEINSKPD